jgi:hypothetical protein
MACEVALSVCSPDGGVSQEQVTGNRFPGMMLVSLWKPIRMSDDLENERF